MNDDNEKEYEIPEPEPKDAVERYEDKLLREKEVAENKKGKRVRINDFGYENRWVNAGQEPPAIVIYCRDNKHSVLHINVGNCLTKTYCPYCNYEYLTDSSD